LDNHSQGYENDPNNGWGIFAGLLIGSLVGAGIRMLLAPRSGKKTRAQIQQITIELRDQTREAMEAAMAQAGVKARQIRAGILKQANDLEQRSLPIFSEQKKRLSTLFQAEKKLPMVQEPDCG
jgi:gas vesicle protein